MVEGAAEAAGGPLAGLLVVDLSRVLAGPFCTMMLADLGARVLKVERPGVGDDARSYGPFWRGESMYFQRVNRGKLSIALDLLDKADREVLVSIIAKADVLVENFRPGVMARLGLSYDVVSEFNPRLVYASVSGFGQTGPLRDRPAYDAVVQGMSGVMSVTGEAGGEPTKPGVPIADLSAGLYAFGGVLAALLGRERTGHGTHVDVAMFDSCVSLLEGAALQFLANGAAPPRIGNAHYAIAPFDTYQCADRQITICAANDQLFVAMCHALGRPGLAGNPLFATNALRHENREMLKERIERALASRTAAEWLEILDAAGVPSGPILDVAEAVGSEQSLSRQMVVSAGGVPVPGNPIKFSAYADPPGRVPAPPLDADGAAIRAEFGA